VLDTGGWSVMAVSVDRHLLTVNGTTTEASPATATKAAPGI
jgi:hypothetical protein